MMMNLNLLKENISFYPEPILSNDGKCSGLSFCGIDLYPGKYTGDMSHFINFIKTYDIVNATDVIQELAFSISQQSPIADYNKNVIVNQNEGLNNRPKDSEIEIPRVDNIMDNILKLEDNGNNDLTIDENRVGICIPKSDISDEARKIGNVTYDTPTLHDIRNTSEIDNSTADLSVLKVDDIRNKVPKMDEIGDVIANVDTNSENIPQPNSATGDEKPSRLSESNETASSWEEDVKTVPLVNNVKESESSIPVACNFDRIETSQRHLESHKEGKVHRVEDIISNDGEILRSVLENNGRFGCFQLENSRILLSPKLSFKKEETNGNRSVIEGEDEALTILVPENEYQELLMESFHNLSVIDEDDLHLGNASDKATLIVTNDKINSVITESLHKVPISPIVYKSSSDNPDKSPVDSESLKKPYLIPFVSENAQENEDNNDPKWDYIRKLTTDEERYAVVRNQWKNLATPDLNLNLTFFAFRNKMINNNTSQQDNVHDSVGVLLKSLRRCRDDDGIFPDNVHASVGVLLKSLRRCRDDDGIFPDNVHDSVGVLLTSLKRCRDDNGIFPDNVHDSMGVLKSLKRCRDDDSELLPATKKPRNFYNLRFNDYAIEKTEILLEKDFEKQRNDPYLSRKQADQMEARFKEYKKQLQFAKKEAQTLYHFYQGLPDQGEVAQVEIEREQWDIEQLYNTFKRFYKWSGNIFNPVISRNQ